MAQQVEHILGKDEVTGSNPVSSSKPRIRAHIASFFRDSDFSHLRHSKLLCPHTQKYTLCTLLLGFSSIRLIGDRNPWLVLRNGAKMRRDALRKQH